MAKSLDNRIATAIKGNRAGSKDLEALIADVEQELNRQKASHEKASAESINFALNEDEREASADVAARAARTIAAFEGALEALRVKLSEKLNNEQESQRRKELEAFTKERDALALEIKAAWDNYIVPFTELLERVKANDERLAGTNIASSEAIAREIPANFYNGSFPYSRLTKIKIPAFKGTANFWPSPPKAPTWSHPSPAEIAAKNQKERERIEAQYNKYNVYGNKTGRVIALQVRGASHMPYGKDANGKQALIAIRHDSTKDEPIICVMDDAMLAEAKKHPLTIELAGNDTDETP